jgi:hypothetical protein
MEHDEHLREKLAALCHEMWSGWMEWLFSEECGLQQNIGDYHIFYYKVERWKRQMKTAYKDLPEDEKDSDRTEADKILVLLQEYLDAQRDQS